MIRSPMLQLAAAALLTVATLSPASAAEPIADPGESAYGDCILCHGTEGRGSEPVSAPRIGGMEAWYIERQLTGFRKGWRGVHEDDYQGGEMRVMALALEDDAAVKEVAKLFARYPVAAQVETVDGDADHGSALYGVCAACHGAKGEGNVTLMAPALAGQNDWYLVTQLNHYREGIRGADADDDLGQQMRAMAASLADEQAVRDVVAYINTLN
ncbi:MAG TPA: c-type cytochrome [Pseudomonadales bacterium]|nr:c-type cytochrome [Pseudomonadales bacterium]